MTERQKHGFIFESKIKELFFITTDISYTAKWDFFYKDKPVSVKCIKENAAVELSSLLRFYENTEPFTLVVGRHNNNIISTVQEVEVTNEILSALKGSISLEAIRDACDTLTLANFPEGSHEAARAYFKHWKNLNKHKLGLLTITGKVDSKKQRRWQCNINNTNWNKLFKDFIRTSTYKNFNFEGFVCQ